MRRAIAPVTAVLGTLAGAAVGQVAGNEFAGSVLGAALAAAADEAGARMLTRWEQRKIRTALGHAATYMHEIWAEGHNPRDDNFFTVAIEPTDRVARSFFQEISEGVVFAAQREHEERKLPFIGHLLAHVAFDAGIDKGTANWAVRTSSELSWTQYVLLAMVGKDDCELPAVDVGRGATDWNSWSVGESLADLGSFRRGLIGAPPTQTPRFGWPMPNLRADEMAHLQGGNLMFGLLGLEGVAAEDIAEVMERLQRIATSPADPVPDAVGPITDV